MYTAAGLMADLCVSPMMWYKSAMRGVKSKNWIQSIRLFTLAVLLVFGQFALVQHETDLEKHVPGGHCEWCIAGSSLHAALGSQAWPSITDILRHVYVTHAPKLVDLSFTAVYFSRAPPTFSAVNP